MSSFDKRLSYFVRSAYSFFLNEGFSCPSCSEISRDEVDRKYWVTRLMRCSHCGLLYRVPTDSANHLEHFYQTTYEEGDTTRMPTEAELKAMLATGFAETGNSYHRYLQVLTALGCRPELRIFEFGCSWGYGAWQLQNAGYDVCAYEISAPRAKFAKERLGINMLAEPTHLVSEFDVFFSAHVLEHLGDVNSAVSLARSVLKNGGLFVAFTPNGSVTYQRQSPSAFHKVWGSVHPVLLGEEWFKREFPAAPMLLATDPYPCDALAAWNKQDSVCLDCSGWELMGAVVFTK